MKKLLSTIVFTIAVALLAQLPGAAQPRAAKLKVTPLKKGKVQLSRGGITSILDLSKDISGCITVYDRSDPKAGKIDTTDFDKIDEVVKGGKTYLLLSSEINSGCNITGECGAASDTTLVWLELSSRLKIVKKKAVVVQSCFWGDINMTDDSGDLKLNKGKLAIEIESNLYKKDLEYSVSKISYDRSKPEQGIVVVTEKRARPE